MSDLPTGKAVKQTSAFRMNCDVAINIKADAPTIWALLTNAEDMPRWNSTVTSIEGPITLGTKLKIKVTLDAKRTFSPKVAAFEADKRMVWADGAAPMFKGARTYTLSPRDDGSTDFRMVEVFTGIMLPMIKGSLPDFGPAFEQYAADLKKEAESKAAG